MTEVYGNPRVNLELRTKMFLTKMVLFVWRLPRNVVILALLGYRAVISPLYGQVCKYHPSCSAYALDSVRGQGLIVGAVLTSWRLLRCNPWSSGGIDDAPVENQFHRAAKVLLSAFSVKSNPTVMSNPAAKNKFVGKDAVSVKPRSALKIRSVGSPDTSRFLHHSSALKSKLVETSVTPARTGPESVFRSRT